MRAGLLTSALAAVVSSRVYEQPVPRFEGRSMYEKILRNIGDSRPIASHSTLPNLSKAYKGDAATPGNLYHRAI